MNRSLPAAALLLVAALFAAPAQAAAAEKAGNSEPGTHVEMPILVAPMTVDGKLQGYAYVSSTVVATSLAAALQVRSRTPFIQDAYVRDVNGASIMKDDPPDQLDRDGLTARLLADARRIAGGALVASVLITQGQISPMQPGAGG